MATAPKPSVALSQPRSLHTALTVTGSNFPPNADVDVELSASRTPTGSRRARLRTDGQGTVQLTFMPVAGDQSVTLKCGRRTVDTDFTVAE